MKPLLEELAMKTLKFVGNTIVLVAAATLAYSSAHAKQWEPAQQVVAYGDLNLDNVAGVRTLYMRIASAARSVCRPVSAIDPAIMRAGAKCARESLADAVKKVDHPELTAYHALRNGGSE